ncbi:MAG TPA: fluoride efflux transporter CrcB [Cyclobacteriaceae bacterium]|jgi:CrcB protein|nr:fluoride efflux transporter CrcB [Cyclobacteriaceae bacterium]
MKELLLVFFGGGLGSTVRFSLGRWVNTLHNHHFPWGTLVVNIVACFVLGFVIGLADHKNVISASSRLFWTVGFCGGFSTFSTFSNETLYLIQSGFTLSLILYISLSLLLCVAAIFGGLYLGEHVG